MISQTFTDSNIEAINYYPEANRLVVALANGTVEEHHNFTEANIQQIIESSNPWVTYLTIQLQIDE